MSADEKLGAFVAGLGGPDAGSLVAGLYLVGSHALDDVRPDSDIDFLCVLHRSPQADEISAVAALHQRLHESWPAPCLDGHYVRVADLRRPADDVVPVLKYVGGERVESGAGGVTAAEWLMLKWRGVRLIGPPVDDLGVDADVEALRAYCRRNLVEYWTPQVERLAELAEVESLVPWVAYQVTWIALGVPRLLASIETGQVLSKTEAGQYALERFPEWRDVLRASLDQRREPCPDPRPRGDGSGCRGIRSSLHRDRAVLSPGPQLRFRVR